MVLGLFSSLPCFCSPVSSVKECHEALISQVIFTSPLRCLIVRDADQGSNRQKYGYAWDLGENHDKETETLRQETVI